ncbi:MAG: hypothetical protein QE271_07835 [Bacteriovoracaceae bacterium]|nr:hypothetical protein [Bacteriovoracaceae bacterium]
MKLLIALLTIFATHSALALPVPCRVLCTTLYSTNQEIVQTLRSYIWSGVSDGYRLYIQKGNQKKVAKFLVPRNDNPQKRFDFKTKNSAYVQNGDPFNEMDTLVINEETYDSVIAEISESYEIVDFASFKESYIKHVQQKMDPKNKHYEACKIVYYTLTGNVIKENLLNNESYKDNLIRFIGTTNESNSISIYADWHAVSNGPFNAGPQETFFSVFDQSLIDFKNWIIVPPSKIKKFAQNRLSEYKNAGVCE